MMDLHDKSRDWLIYVDRLVLLDHITEPRLQLLLAMVVLLSLFYQFLLEIGYPVFKG